MNKEKTVEKLQELSEAVKGIDSILIVPHNNPDPDAVATAVALKYLLAQKWGIASRIVYKGIIGRAENKALVRFLKQPLRRLRPADLRSALAIAVVDTQPGTGNNPLPPQTEVTLVIDHHPRQERTAAAKFADVRPDVGAAASIMVEYLRAAELEIDSMLATALFYGIKTDTMGLGRGTRLSDMDAICYLLPRIDLEALLRIERAQVPPDYFKSFVTALQSTRIYGDVVISYIGPMNYPDLAAEMADFLLRMRGCRWVICMGVYNRRFFISVRTHQQRGAGQLVQKVVGDRGVAGGHGAMAGGQVILNDQDPNRLSEIFAEGVLAHLDIPADVAGQSLV